LLSPQSLVVLVQGIFLRHPGYMERLTGLSFVIANVPSERHQTPDKRGKAQNENRKQYAHENLAQE
jgi:hypothetical protein